MTKTHRVLVAPSGELNLMAIWVRALRQWVNMQTITTASCIVDQHRDYRAPGIHA